VPIFRFKCPTTDGSELNDDRSVVGHVSQSANTCPSLSGSTYLTLDPSTEASNDAHCQDDAPLVGSDTASLRSLLLRQVLTAMDISYG